MSKTVNENARNEELEKVRTKAKWIINECQQLYNGLMTCGDLNAIGLQVQVAADLLSTMVNAGRLKCDVEAQSYYAQLEKEETEAEACTTQK